MYLEIIVSRKSVQQVLEALSARLFEKVRPKSFVEIPFAKFV